MGVAWKGCSGLKCNPLNFLPNVHPVTTAVVDFHQPVVVNPNNVIYTPPATTQNPHPTPTKIPKPIEGSVTNINGVIKVQNIGFCFEPFIGYQYTLGADARPYLSARLIYDDNLGVQVGVNDERAFLGFDYRLPVLNLLTVAAGESMSYTANLAPYVALNAELSLH